MEVLEGDATDEEMPSQPRRRQAKAERRKEKMGSKDMELDSQEVLPILIHNSKVAKGKIYNQLLVERDVEAYQQVLRSNEVKQTRPEANRVSYRGQLELSFSLRQRQRKLFDRAGPPRKTKSGTNRGETRGGVHNGTVRQGPG